ncbi:MAG TPA: helix-turn-helix transcriptional regulator [Thermoanaerobaculia bacterium]|nr:helix-turn-helix transcriptional regulator [Thermoanaerobaculia bacterium]
MQTLGERLRELREKRGISLRNLAARVRITAPYLSDIELNRRHPSQRVLGELARALHAPVEDLHALDPRGLLMEVEQRIRSDVDFARALRELLNRCTTAEDLMRIIAQCTS